MPMAKPSAAKIKKLADDAEAAAIAHAENASNPGRNTMSAVRDALSCFSLADRLRQAAVRAADRERGS